MKHSLLAFLAAIGLLAAPSDASAAPGKSPVSIGRNRPADAPPTTVTSDRLEFDYDKWVSLFDGNVVVTDPEFKLTCDRLAIAFINTNDVNEVRCRGHVVMDSDDIHAQCGMATYTRENACVCLEGAFDDKLTMPIVKKGPQTLSGKKIFIWLETQRVIVDQGVGVEAHPDSMTSAKTPAKEESPKEKAEDKAAEEESK